MRVVSNQERIEAAIATILLWNRAAIRDPENDSCWYLIADMPKFGTVEKFFVSYPDCCYIRTVVSGEYGRTGEIVVIRFPVQYAGYGGVEKTGNVKIELAVTPCGRIVTDSSD